MRTCPRCHAAQVVVALDATKSGRCLVCGTRWIQDGSAQRKVVGPAVLRPALEAVEVAEASEREP